MEGRFWYSDVRRPKTLAWKIVELKFLGALIMNNVINAVYDGQLIKNAVYDAAKAAVM